jgi:predicted Zn-dependent peptidase
VPARRQATGTRARAPIGSATRAQAITRLPIAPIPYRVFRAQLANGLRVRTVEAHHLHWAAADLYVRAGSCYETKATNGLSHLVEHMLFRGSSGYPESLALNRAIEELGGTLYGETGRDYSQISLHLSRVGGALDILGDLFSSPSFREIEVERSIILEDFDERGRNVNVDDLSREAALPNHPLGYSIVGLTSNGRRFGVPEVRRQFKRLYGGRNMVLCVAGRVNRAGILAATRRSFRGGAAGTRAAPKAPQVVLKGPRFRRVWRDSAQTQLQLLFCALPEWDPGYPALVALLRVLDDGMSTRLTTASAIRRASPTT